MKSITSKTLIATLVLGALGAPLSAYAADDSAEVKITAIVTEQFTLAVDKEEVNFDNVGNTPVQITTTSTSSTHGAATLTIESTVDASGSTMNLKHGSDPTKKYPINVQVDSKAATFASNVMTHQITAVNNRSKNTILNLTAAIPPTGPAVDPGTYRGTLKIKVAPQ